MTSTPAVFVHSLDAALIQGVLTFGAITTEGSFEDDDFHVTSRLMVDQRGKPLPIIIIHDCFACHASFAPDLQKVLLRGLRVMYEYFDPLNQFLKQVETTTTVPTPQVDDSEFEWENWAKNAFS